MPTLDELAAQTIGEQAWRILRLEEANRQLWKQVQALRMLSAQELSHASAVQGATNRDSDCRTSS